MRGGVPKKLKVKRATFAAFVRSGGAYSVVYRSPDGTQNPLGTVEIPLPMLGPV